MAAYGFFAAGTAALVLVVVILARATERELDPQPAGGARLRDRTLSVRELYTNVVFSQVLVLGLLVLIVWLTAVPSEALGTGATPLPFSYEIGVGLGLGLALYLANAASVIVLDRLGIEYSEALRRSLAPEGIAGWFVLLAVVLPVIALAEELIFRAALIGAIHAGFGIHPAILVILSSVVFAVGHGVQGPGGILVTGLLGIVLGTAFVVTGSLLVVVVAHYVVNALEFLIHEGLDVDPVS